MYELPSIGSVVLTFRSAVALPVELSHRPDGVVIWRPADTEVWATTLDGSCEQIAGWQHNPFPGLDSGGAQLDKPGRELIERLFHDADPATFNGGRLGPGAPAT